MTPVCDGESPAAFLDVLRGAKWGAEIHTHRRTATDMRGTQCSKSEGIWTFTNTKSGQADFFKPPLQSPVMIPIKTGGVFP